MWLEILIAFLCGLVVGIWLTFWSLNKLINM